MNGKTTLAGSRRRRKMITALWVTAISIGVILLIYWEMTAILYILATLSVTALLIIVANSDLAHTDKTVGQLSSTEAAPALVNGAPRNTPSR